MIAWDGSIDRVVNDGGKGGVALVGIVVVAGIEC